MLKCGGSGNPGRRAKKRKNNHVTIYKEHWFEHNMSYVALTRWWYRGSRQRLEEKIAIAGRQTATTVINQWDRYLFVLSRPVSLMYVEVNQSPRTWNHLQCPGMWALGTITWRYWMHSQWDSGASSIITGSTHVVSVPKFLQLFVRSATKLIRENWLASFSFSLSERPSRVFGASRTLNDPLVH